MLTRAWIGPAEIEAVVTGPPPASLAAAIGRPDSGWGEGPVLVIRPRDRDGASDDDILAPLRGRVAPWWFPGGVIRLERMPLAATGKIDKMRSRVDHGAC
ncbi:MAG: hypothetical protein H2038_09260 [Brevundimonas sp.]|uniref:AMP-binding enzyme n=1 Tax=Brevundimonas sp. TaxID=1871086 RepID=UPI00182409F0|nr:hypothetical protein [Brevundimonas sp.]MBA4804823.1 hypothetical protein [Brevundimonas sp.]